MALQRLLTAAAGGAGDRLGNHFYENGIYTTLRYYPLHLNAIYQSDAVLPNSEKLNEQALSLPSIPD